MISKKIVVIVTACISIGLSIIVACTVSEWYITSDVSFMQWVKSSDGIRYILGFVGNFAVSLISASVFLIGVQFIIEKTRNKESEDRKISFLRNNISKEMRENSEECLKKIKSYENREMLLRNQYFVECNFKAKMLDGENFSGTNFKGACFVDASLVGAILTRCILDGVNFEGSKLSFADFTSASVDVSTLKVAHSLWKATMPDGSRYDGRFNLRGDLETAKKMGYNLLDAKQHEKFYEQE